MGTARARVDLCVAAPVAGPVVIRRVLLLGTSLLVYAAAASPAQAQDECGAPPPGGGTVTCPAGLYPDGISYDVVDDLTVVLQPGVETEDTVSVLGDDVRIEGQTGTLIQSSASSAPGVYAYGSNSVFVGVDDVSTTGASDALGIYALAENGTTIVSDSVATLG